MFPHSDTIYAVRELSRQEILQQAARQRLAATVVPAIRPHLNRGAARDRLQGMLGRIGALFVVSTFAIVAVFAFALAALSSGELLTGRAQVATPAAGGAIGVTTQLLGRVPAASAPGQALALLEITFAPGGSMAAHIHPGGTIIHLASGTLQYTVVEGEARLVRAVAGVPSAATPTAVEPMPVGTEVTLHAGDTVYYDGAVLQSERNDGAEDAVLLASNLRGVDEPARVMFHEDMATPAS